MKYFSFKENCLKLTVDDIFAHVGIDQEEFLKKEGLPDLDPRQAKAN